MARKSISKAQPQLPQTPPFSSALNQEGPPLIAKPVAQHDRPNPPLTQDDQLVNFGLSGLVRSGNYIFEEFLKELQGQRGYKLLREMRDNDPTVGAMLYMLEQMSKQVDWQVQPYSDDQATLQDEQRAEYIRSCLMDDMDKTWPETLSEISSMYWAGFAPMEMCYKIRRGEQVDPSVASSNFNDGLWGWDHWGVRAQETVLYWQFDARNKWQALAQQAPPDYLLRLVPREKVLLFRVKSDRDNPEGRALAPDTPIPTPDGWKHMGDLQVGDAVYDDQGKVCHVSAVQGWEKRPAYRLHFADGTSIVADANHQWKTATIHERAKMKRWSMRTTEELAEYRAVNTAIPTAKPLEGFRRWLPIHPYVLGLWLGDGCKNTGTISGHARSMEEQRKLVQDCGYEVSQVLRNGPENGNGRIFRIYSDFQKYLGMLGVQGNKHIPEAYLRAPYHDRLALLQGLMDSDGTVDTWGRCSFANTNERITRGFMELVRSLGLHCRGHFRAANGKERLTTCANISFQPHGIMPFRLSCKAKRVKQDCDKRHVYRHHYVRKVEKLQEPIDTVCIEVDAPSHMFLAGEGMVPTHNSLLRNAYPCWMRKKRLEAIEAIGIERRISGFPVLTPPEGLDLWNTNNAAAAAKLAAAQKLVRNVRMDDQMGMVKPFGWTFELMSAQGGSAAMDTNAIIDRYDHRMAMTIGMDFLFLGSGGKGGARAQATVDVELFNTAFEGILSGITEVPNRFAIPKLCKFNGWNDGRYPKLVHGDASSPNLAALGTFIVNLAQAGMQLFPDEDLEHSLRAMAGLPEAVGGVQKRKLSKRGRYGKQVLRHVETKDAKMIQAVERLLAVCEKMEKSA